MCLYSDQALIFLFLETRFGLYICSPNQLKLNNTMNKLVTVFKSASNHISRSQT